MTKELLKLLNKLRNAGFRIVRNKHWKVYLKNGNHVAISGSASDMNYLKRVKQDFRKHGIELDDE